MIAWLRRRLWRGNVSAAWLQDYSRRASCEGFHVIGESFWLKSEAHDQQRAEFKRRVHVWQDAQRKERERNAGICSDKTA